MRDEVEENKEHRTSPLAPLRIGACLLGDITKLTVAQSARSSTPRDKTDRSFLHSTTHLSVTATSIITLPTGPSHRHKARALLQNASLFPFPRATTHPETPYRLIIQLPSHPSHPFTTPSIPILLPPHKSHHHPPPQPLPIKTHRHRHQKHSFYYRIANTTSSPCNAIPVFLMAERPSPIITITPYSPWSRRRIRKGDTFKS